MSLLQRLQSDTYSRIEEARPRTVELWQRGNRFSPKRPFQPVIAQGSGAYVVDVDGHRLLDCANSMSALVLGHAHPAVVKALVGQVRDGTAFGYPPATQFGLIEELVERLPAAERLVLANSGTEAVLHAIRVARAHTERQTIVVVDGGFHGHIAELSFDPGLRRWRDVVRVPLNDNGALQRVFEELAGQIAGFVIEPILSRAGQLPASTQFLANARALTEAAQAVLVFDEVATFRHARGGMQERLGVAPDLTVLGKSIGGGLPVGALAGGAGVMSVLSRSNRPIETGGTFSGNPVTSVAGLATLAELTPSAYARLDAIGDRFRNGVEGALVIDGLRLAVSGRGSLLNLHLERAAPVGWARVNAQEEMPFLNLLALRLWELGFVTTYRGMYAFSTVTADVDVDRLIDAVLDGMAWMAKAVEEEGFLA